MVFGLLNEHLDWLLVVRFALEHKVVPLLYRGFLSLGPGAIPGEIVEPLRIYADNVATNNLSITRALIEVLDAMAAVPLPVIPFKGIDNLSGVDR